MEQAQERLNRVEGECTEVGPRLNARKTEEITHIYTIHMDHPQSTKADGNALQEVSDFKYLGSWMNSTEQDIEVRKALACRALNVMTIGARISYSTRLWSLSYKKSAVVTLSYTAVKAGP